jgi:Uma2 family endonuclease
LPTRTEGMTMKTTPTTPTIDPGTIPEPLSAPPATPAIPSLDDLYQMEPDVRRVFRGVDWEFYERLHEVVGERPSIRIAYDGKDLEIMVTGPLHDDFAESAGDLVRVIAEELDIPWRAMGRTTWKRKAVARGIEADQCFHFHPEKLAASAAALKRKSNDVADYPNPDLAIEIDISRPEVDRLGIYAALRVPEVWRFDDEGLTIGRLNDQGSFDAVEASGLLPIRKDEIARSVLEEDRSDIRAWKRRLREWVRAELAGRRRVQ